MEKNIGPERLRPKSEEEEARLHEWLEIAQEAQSIVYEKSTEEMIELLEKKAKGEISDEEFKRESYALGKKYMTDALKEVLEKRSK